MTGSVCLRATICTVVASSVWAGPVAGSSASTSRSPVFAAAVNSNDREYLVVGHLGGTSRRIYSANGLGGIREVAVSWDGARVAFAYSDANDEEQLGVINADGSGFRQLTHANHAYFEHTAWSTNDRTIFYGRPFTPADPTRSSYARVWRVAADGSSRPALIDGASHASPSSARPGGRWLALNSFRPETGYGRCAVMHVDGTSRHNVGPDNCEDALWRPETPQLAISRVTSDTYSNGPTVQIWLLSLKTHRYHVLPNVQDATGGGLNFPLAWMNDGSVLYYEHRTHLGALTVYRIKPDGSGKRDVTPSVPRQRTDDFAVQPSLP